MVRMDDGLVEQRLQWYREQTPEDGRDWYVWADPFALDLPGEGVMRFRGEGSYARVFSFEEYIGREGSCVKVLKSGIDDPESRYKELSELMFDMEVRALIRAGEASIPGVVRLKAVTVWDNSSALVLADHGTLTLRRAIYDEDIVLTNTQKDDIIGQLIQAVVGLNSAGIAHNDISPGNIMLQFRIHPDETTSYLTTLIDLGASTVLADDGFSRPGLCGTRGFIDSHVNFARDALLNGISIPHDGCVKGINTDMFSVAKVALLMYDDLDFNPHYDTVTSISEPPRNGALLDILSRSISRVWNERLSPDQLAGSPFMQAWRTSSKHAITDDAAGGALPVPQQIQEQLLQGQQPQHDDAGSEDAVVAQVPYALDHGGSGEGQGSGGSAFRMASPAGAAAQVASADDDGGEKSVGQKGIVDEDDSSSNNNNTKTIATGDSSRRSSSGSPGGERLIGGCSEGTTPAGAVARAAYDGGGAAGSSSGGDGNAGEDGTGMVHAAAAAAAAAGVESGEAAAAPAASAGMETTAATAEDDGTPASAVGAACLPTLGKRRRDREEGDGGKASVRPRRHGGGGGSGAGANIIGATGDPAPVKRSVRSATRTKTAQSLRAKAIREAAGTGPKTRSMTSKKRERDAGSTAAGGGAPSKRPRHATGTGPKTRSMTSEKRKRDAGATAAGGGAPSKRSRGR